jgi:hypothetical protein
VVRKKVNNSVFFDWLGLLFFFRRSRERKGTNVLLGGKVSLEVKSHAEVDA